MGMTLVVIVVVRAVGRARRATSKNTLDEATSRPLLGGLLLLLLWRWLLLLELLLLL